MGGVNKNSFGRLRKLFSKGGNGYFSLPDLRDDPQIAPVLADAFECKETKFEPIYGLDALVAIEILSRPKSRIDMLSNHVKNIGTITESFYEAGNGVEIDEVLCRNSLDSAPKDTPFTLNISTASAADPKFFERLEEPLSQFDPKNVIWEILEHRIARDTDISHLHDMKDQGYRFWLDDFLINPQSASRLLAPEHQSRIDVFAKSGLAESIKLDGSIVLAGLGYEDDSNEYGFDCLDRAVSYIRGELPDINLVAERVQNRGEADRLFSMGFNGVQGFNLNSRDFLYESKEKSAFEGKFDLAHENLYLA